MTSSILIIPAREGSKGVKEKNRRPIKGTPLFLRTLNHARIVAGSTLDICISSDDAETWKLFLHHMKLKGRKWSDIQVNEIVKYGNIWFHKRSLRSSGDSSLVISLLQEIRSILKKNNQSFITWCLFQPTTPFRSRSELESIRNFLRTCNEFESLVSVTKVEEIHPARMYSINGNSLVSLPGYEETYYSRRQDLPEVYIRDGGFYVIGDSLVRDGVQYSQSPKFIQRNWPWSINIDSVQDFLIASTVESELVADDPNESVPKYES
jgi:CMP-N,N'-diacetyllegionaminic acid synthase